LKHRDIVVAGNAMSTRVCGEYDRVFALVAKELQTNYERFGKAVLVCKFIVGDLDIQA
jgi:hypothetical protein